MIDILDKSRAFSNVVKRPKSKEELIEEEVTRGVAFYTNDPVEMPYATARTPSDYNFIESNLQFLIKRDE